MELQVPTSGGVGTYSDILKLYEANRIEFKLLWWGVGTCKPIPYLKTKYLVESYALCALEVLIYWATAS